MEECRIISCGLRVTPLIPGTAAPGTAYVASLPTSSYQSVYAISPNGLGYSPLFKWGSAAGGAWATSRPIDPDSFIFHHDNVLGFPIDKDAPVTVPVVVMTGLPANCPVNVEAVMHVEGLATVSAVSA